MSRLPSPVSGLPQVTLIGAGLAGSLLSLYLARRGFAVDICERRPDMRKGQIGGGRSINLALSTRGIHALKDVGLHEQIMKIAIPMKGRMIHSPAGELMFQRYGKDDSEVIYATSRSELNIALMNAAEKQSNVRIHFSQRCTGMNVGTGDITLVDETSGRSSSVQTSAVIGTDGSASAIRTAIGESIAFDFSEQYLEYGYKELIIPAGPEGTFLLEKNALHIWPRGVYMLIALPNIDGSFTCTFFFPFEGPISFATLNSEAKVLEFFQQQFPDAVALMPGLLEDYFTNPTGSMVTIKCKPWHVGGRVALLGDAAHAIVPFFGQGMNCAFEDCTVLDEIMGNMEKGEGLPAEAIAQAVGREKGEKRVEWERGFREFERQRKVNADAIADMAVENFVEMRDHVAQPKFQLKKRMEAALQQRFPDIFIPKYSMVTFHRVPYSVALLRGRVQDKILDELGFSITSPEEIDWKKADELIHARLTSLYD